MNERIQAIFENGVIRPLIRLDLHNGEEVEVILLKKPSPDSEDAGTVIQKIAELPLEGGDDAFSGADHDSVLYPPAEQ